MEVHQPEHPIHSFRDFLKEVGIIVLGVLIALAAEQSVEALRERHAAADAHQSIDAEIAANLGSLGNRVRTQPCTAAPAYPGSPSACIPINTPRADALRRVAAESGDNLGEP